MRFSLKLSFIFLFFWMGSIMLKGQHQVTNFEHYGIEDGISHSTIYSIVQDQTGFLWVGTEDGLNRYDGYEFRSFYHDPTNPNTLSSSNSNVLLVENERYLWVGTWGGGVNRVNLETYNIERFVHDADNPKSLSGNRIQSLFKDSKGNIWIGSASNGLNKFNPALKNFTHYKNNPVLNNSLGNDRIWGISEDREGNIWVATSGGAYLMDQNKETFQQIEITSDVSVQEIRSVLADSKNRIWIGTRDGLFVKEKDSISMFKTGGVLFNHIINKVYEDDLGEFWIATMNKGVYRLDENLNIVNHYYYDANLINGVQHDDVRIVFRDKSGVVWLGSRGSGLSKLDLRRDRFGHHLVEPKHKDNLEYNRIWAVHSLNNNKLFVGTDFSLDVFTLDKTSTKRQVLTLPLPVNENPLIRAIFVDSKNRLWVGTSGYGVFVSFNSGKSFKSVRILDDQRNSNSGRSRFIDEIDGEIWLATQSGMFVLNEKSNTFEPKFEDIYQGHVRHFIKDRKKQIWLSTLDGLILINENVDQHRVFVPSESENSISFGVVNATLEDSEGRLWIATSQGLNLFDPNTREFQHFYSQQGLPNHVINGIVEETNSPYLWISTNRGLSRMNRLTFKIENFDVHSGLQGNIYMTGVFDRSDSGDIVFGGFNGFNVFNPKNIVTSDYQPNIAITDFRVFEESQSLNLSRGGSPRVTLSYKENFIAFDVSSLDFINPSKIKYRYQLEGLNQNWVNTAGERTIKYTNLEPKSYTLKVQGTNSDGVWSEQILSISLNIIPPFWKQPWFLILMILGMVAVSGGAIYNYIHALRSKNTSLTGKVQESQEELREREELFRLISENAMDWIMVLNRNQKLDYCSPAVELLLGIEPKIVQAKTLLHFVHPKDVQRFTTKIESTFENNTVIEESFSFLTHDNQERILELSGSTILDRNKSEKLLVLIAHDITNRIEMERGLRRAKREADKANKTKSAFLAGMSHELRTPLNAILGFSQIMHNDSSLSAKNRNYVDILQRSGSHLLSMINDVLDLSKIEAGKMELHVESADVHGLMQDLRSIFAMQAREKNLNFTIEQDATIPHYIESDESKIRQVLINFLGNAIKYSDEGSVVLTSRFYHEKPDFERLTKNGFKKIDPESSKIPKYLEGKEHGWLYFSVADTGPGIAKNQISEIFKPFKQTGRTRSRGTGLGLAISMSLVQLLGGHVFVKTGIGEGSNFVLLLPGIEAAIDPTKTNERQRIVGIKGTDKKSVLILDDIETNIFLLTELLEPIGFTCYSAITGEEAIDIFKEKNPDLMLLDLRLPGMSGEQTLKAIRKLAEGQNTPAIAVTASVLDEDREEVMKAGFQGFIHKPLKSSELFDHIARISNIEFVYESEEILTKTKSKKDTKSVIQAITNLKDGDREKVVEAIELTDFEALSAMKETILADSAFEELNLSVARRNIRFILDLVDQLENGNLA